MSGRDPYAALDALGEQRAKGRWSRPKAAKVREEGPNDCRITTTRRISLTGLLSPGVDLLALRPTSSGLVLTTDVVCGTTVLWTNQRHLPSRARARWKRWKS